MPIDYSCDDIRVLSNAEAIRMRPEMYVGPLSDPHILNRLVEEALCLTVDEATCGRCTELAVSVGSRGFVTIRDNGPGFSMEPDEHGRLLIEMILTQVGACRNAKESASVRNACCHIGIVAVNALSEYLSVRVFRDGGCWFQEYRKGIAQAPFHLESETNETGLELSFLPDRQIFGDLEFDALALASWLPTAGVRFDSLEHVPSNNEIVDAVTLRFKGLQPIDAQHFSCP